MGWGRGAVVSVVLVCMLATVAAWGQQAPAEGSSGHGLRDLLVNHERELAAAQTHKQSAALEHLLDPQLIFVAFNGLVFTKAQLVSKLQYIDVAQYEMENFKVRQLGPGAALLTYDLRVKASVAGHDLPATEYASSVWMRDGGGWQLVFHQETPAHHS